MCARAALFYCLCLFWCLPLAAQKKQARKTRPATHQTKSKSRAQLEREKRENLRKIKETARILEQTKAKKEATVGQLNAIKQKITVQTGIITTISKELNYLDNDVNELESVVGAMQTDLDKLRAEYAALVYATYKAGSPTRKLVFLFASESFNQFYRRLQYLKQYTTVRKQQFQQITRVQQALSDQLLQLSQKRSQKNNLLQSQVAENQNLVHMKNEQDQVVTSLSRKEKELQQDLREKEAAVKKVQLLIADIVREEMAKAAAAARRRELAKKNSGTAAKSTPSTTIELTPEASLVSSSFAANKNHLLWPVAKGFIAQHFGRQPHPALRNVMVENLGIDIQTNAGEPVRAVFDGTVATKAYIQGMGNVVMVQHGQYFTVYGNLRSTQVNTGQKVKAKDTLGTVATDADNLSVLKFFIWKGNTKLNPEAWLLRK